MMHAEMVTLGLGDVDVAVHPHSTHHGTDCIGHIGVGGDDAGGANECCYGGIVDARRRAQPDEGHGEPGGDVHQADPTVERRASSG